MKIKLLAFILAAVLCFSLFACGKEETKAPDDEKTVLSENTEEIPEDSWVFYWYLCGSNLETNDGSATKDLYEMMEVRLPENVKVVIQTGGALEWNNDFVDASKTQRWLYSSEGLELIEELELCNMGDGQTLYDFISFADENYPAKKVCVNFWNHGGGSVDGIAFDEIYEFDSLDIDEIYQAFDAVWPADPDQPALEMVGFDACLMATVDVAAAVMDFSKYMVASEELEPDNGWDYTGWLGALAEDTQMTGDELGRIICDTYFESCKNTDAIDVVTLSLIDLSQLPPLLEAYEAFGREALCSVAQDFGFFAEMTRIASVSENYGGNSTGDECTNMVDLGDLAVGLEDLLPCARYVSEALDECVVYKANGRLHAGSEGLSCYYSYDNNLDSIDDYMELGVSTAFKYLNYYKATGREPQGSGGYLSSVGIKELPGMVTLKDKNWNEMPFEVRDDGAASLTLGPDAKDILAEIGFSLFRKEEDRVVFLGTDDDIFADWENGVFYDNFNGTWGAIDGHTVHMELAYIEEDKKLYTVPILLDGEEYELVVAYDINKDEWEISGAKSVASEEGMAGKEIRSLEEGDVISLVMKEASDKSKGEYSSFVYDELEFHADTSFGETPLPDGKYFMAVVMEDVIGNIAYSSPISFICSADDITIAE